LNDTAIGAQALAFSSDATRQDKTASMAPESADCRRGATIST
jgi:hypothetical protein